VDQGRLVNAAGGGFPVPDVRENPVVGVICVNKLGQVGVVYSTLVGSRLLLLDIDGGFFTSDFLNSAAARAVQLQASIPMSVGAATYRMATVGNAPDVPMLFIVGMGAAASVTSFSGIQAVSIDIVPEDLVMFIPGLHPAGARSVFLHSCREITKPESRWRSRHSPRHKF
jgi:hypothetical protein